MVKTRGETPASRGETCLGAAFVRAGFAEALGAAAGCCRGFGRRRLARLSLSSRAFSASVSARAVAAIAHRLNASRLRNLRTPVLGGARASRLRFEAGAARFGKPSPSWPIVEKRFSLNYNPLSEFSLAVLFRCWRRAGQGFRRRLRDH